MRIRIKQVMRNLAFIGLVLILAACVPIKKYRDLEANYNKCLEEQSIYKSKAIDYENQVKELNIQLDQMRNDITALKSDTSSMGEQYRNLKVEYQKAQEINHALEEKYAQAVTNGSVENAKLVNELEATRVELQKKEDLLNQLEKN
ncbi:MAG: hypothetical protein IPH24_10400 [Crocinitomicaceae bacterium]|nr:hypothetical protein [Crocinitomicaceae bacterium]